MNNALIQFHENLNRAREMGALASALKSVTTDAIDVSDMWRAQIVLVVSALDHFIHDLTRLGMIEASKGSRHKTESYLRFQMPFSAVDSALNGVPHENWVGETVRVKHSWQSFQDQEKLAEAIRLICSVKLWEEVGSELNMPPKDIKTRLELIVERRNKIAHEADLDPASPGFRWPINAALASDTIDFIESLGKAIFKIVQL